MIAPVSLMRSCVSSVFEESVSESIVEIDRDSNEVRERFDLVMMMHHRVFDVAVQSSIVH